jgi:Trk K+ transport system NAD-binding subunit
MGCERFGILIVRLVREGMEIVVISLMTEEVNQTSRNPDSGFVGEGVIPLFY